MNQHASFGGGVRAALLALLLAGAAAAMPAQAAASAHDDSPRAETTSFHFSNIPVRSALQLIAEEGRFNLVVSDSVQGTISLHLDDVTWEQALAVVVRMKGLGLRIDGGTRTMTATGG